MFSLDVASMLDSLNLINIHMHNAQTHKTDLGNISRFYRLQLRKRAVVTFLKTTRHMSASVFSTREVCQGQSHAGRKGNVPLECFLYGFFLSLSKAYITSIHHPTFSDVPQTSILLKSAITSLLQRNCYIMEEFIWNCRVNSLCRD